MKIRIKGKKVNNGLQIEDNQYSQLSPNFLELGGKKHSQGGVNVNFQGTVIEAEKGETMSINDEGSAIVFGNLEVPGSKKKFKTVAKELAKGENKADRMQNKATKYIEEANPFNPFSSLTFNTGSVLQDAAQQRKNSVFSKKEELAETQQLMLDIAEQTGNKPEKVSSIFQNGGKLKAKMKDGGKIPATYIAQLVRQEAINQGVDPELMLNLVSKESSFNPKAKSDRGALGIMQLMPDTAKKYGIASSDLTSTDPEVLGKVINAGVSEFKGLQETYGDNSLALVAYNAGPDAIEFVKKQTGNKNITGEDWLSFMQNRRDTKPSKKPHAWQNETFNYVNEITRTKGKPDDVPVDSNNIQFPSFLPDVNEDISATIPDPNYKSPFRKSGVVDDNFMERQPVNYRSSTQPVANRRPTTSAADMNKLRLTDFLSEIPAIFDRADYVQGQKYEPQLYQPFQVSFQDRINQNNSTFRAISQQVPNNPAALSVLAGQKYNVDNQVLGEEFRTNQQIANEVTNKNTGLLNDAMLKNLELQDLQYARQEQAKAITQSRREQGLASISSKIAQNRRDNTTIRLSENLFDYRPDSQGVMEYQGPAAQFNFSGSQSSVPARTRVRYDATGNPVYTQEDYIPYNNEIAQQELLERQRRAASQVTKKWGGFIPKTK